MKIGIWVLALALLMSVATGCQVPGPRAPQAVAPERWAVPAPPVVGLPCGVQPGLPWACPAIEAILLHQQELGLSTQQADALMKLRLDASLRATDLNARREETCTRLDAALSKEKVDLMAVRNLVNAIAQAEAEMYYTGIEASVKAEQVLSADQVARLDQIMPAPTWQMGPPGPQAPPGTGPMVPVATPPAAPAGPPMRPIPPSGAAPQPGIGTAPLSPAMPRPGAAPTMPPVPPAPTP